MKALRRLFETPPNENVEEHRRETKDAFEETDDTLDRRITIMSRSIVRVSRARDASPETFTAVLNECVDAVLLRTAASSVDTFLALLAAPGREGELNRKRARLLRATSPENEGDHILVQLLQKVVDGDQMRALLSHTWLYLDDHDERALRACAARLNMVDDPTVTRVLRATRQREPESISLRSRDDVSTARDAFSGDHSTIRNEMVDAQLRQRAATSSVGTFITLLAAPGREGQLNRRRASALRVSLFGAYDSHVLTVLVQGVKNVDQLSALLLHEWIRLDVHDVRALRACAARFNMADHPSVDKIVDAQDEGVVVRARELDAESKTNPIRKYL